MRVSASIVIYEEEWEVLQRAIESFLNIELEKELVIVDNSKMNLLEKFCKNYDLKYIFNGKNIGFGQGHNLAFRNLQKKSNIHIIINPDVFFNSNEIKNFILWSFNQKNLSLSVPKVLNLDGTIQNTIRDIPTIKTFFLRMFFDSNKGNINIKELDIISEIPFAHGCFFVFKSEIFEKLSGFDKRFFMYMDDVDICIRAKQYGKVILNQKYVIYHIFRRSSKKNLKMFFFHFISAIKFFLK